MSPPNDHAAIAGPSWSRGPAGACAAETVTTPVWMLSPGLVAATAPGFCPGFEDGTPTTAGRDTVAGARATAGLATATSAGGAASGVAAQASRAECKSRAMDAGSGRVVDWARSSVAVVRAAARTASAAAMPSRLRAVRRASFAWAAASAAAWALSLAAPTATSACRRCSSISHDSCWAPSSLLRASANRASPWAFTPSSASVAAPSCASAASSRFYLASSAAWAALMAGWS